MPAIKVFSGEDVQVPEGSSHEFECEFKEASGAYLSVGAVLTIRGWLDDHASGVNINSRANQNILGVNGGALVNGPLATPPRPDGVGVFIWSLDAADAPIVNSGPVATELHRITLKVTYTRTGGGTGVLTHQVLYPVVALERI
jgi:hypothetical protein